MWIWREGRVKKFKKYVDHMLLLFNFEKKYFDKENIIKKYTYAELDNLVSKMSEYIFLKKKDKKNFNVMIHASASIDSSVSMLSCAKLGIHFSVIFEDLAPEAISTRISLFKPDIFISS